MGNCANCCNPPKQQGRGGLMTTWNRLVPQAACTEEETSCSSKKVGSETASHTPRAVWLHPQRTPSITGHSPRRHQVVASHAAGCMKHAGSHGRWTTMWCSDRQKLLVLFVLGNVEILTPCLVRYKSYSSFHLCNEMFQRLRQHLWDAHCSDSICMIAASKKY